MVFKSHKARSLGCYELFNPDCDSRVSNHDCTPATPTGLFLNTRAKSNDWILEYWAGFVHQARRCPWKTYVISTLSQSLTPPYLLSTPRLSRHGFTDVMKDTVDSFAQTTPSQNHQPIPIDLDLEATDPLAKHEITLQFAAFRALSSGGGGGGGEATAPRHQSGGGGGRDGVASPTSLYFTYQFYTCLPTRTERMLLRPDGPKDRLYQVLILSSISK